MAGLLIVILVMATKGGTTVNEPKIVQTGTNEARVENDNVHALVNLHVDKMESKFMWMAVAGGVLFLCLCTCGGTNIFHSLAIRRPRHQREMFEMNHRLEICRTLEQHPLSSSTRSKA